MKMIQLDKYCIHLCHFIQSLILVSDPVLAYGNYPKYADNPKPCSKLHATINFQGRICMPKLNEEWDKASVDNCVGPLKAECPEFNKAECVWFPWIPPDPAQAKILNDRPLLLPCCRLKYFAAGSQVGPKTTWAEIFYGNQLGTSEYNTTVFDVVEVGRFIKDKTYFANKDQQNWPMSVQDPQGERGLRWLDLKPNPAIPSLVGKPLCPNGEDIEQHCSVLVLDYISTAYKEGLNKSSEPALSEMETKNRARITFEFETKCAHILVDRMKRAACIVVFVRRSEFVFDDGIFWNFTAKISEAQVYKDKGDKDPLLARYAYYSYETIEVT